MVSPSRRQAGNATEWARSKEGPAVRRRRRVSDPREQGSGTRTAGGFGEPGEGGLRVLRRARRDVELRILHRRPPESGVAQQVRVVRGGRGQPHRDGAEVRGPHPDRGGASGDQPRRRSPTHCGDAGVRLRGVRLQRRAHRGGDGGHRVPVGRGTSRQRRLGHSPGRRDGVLPPRLIGSVVAGKRLFRRNEQRRSRRGVLRLAAASAAKASATVFLIMRRMRAPLIVLIVIFAITVLGLTLIPGQDAQGRPWRMGFFDAFYVMSYTATTIGFGEIPYPFTYNQRMWVTVSIYLTVIGWAYAIGSLLALLQDRSFRQALALQRFRRTVSRLGEPFVLVAGSGRAGELLGHALDALGRRFVVLDTSPERIDGIELDSFHADVPGLAADVRDPGHLAVAGLGSPRCEAVVALTDDEEVNLSVVMAAALLRPDVPVVARATSRTMQERMAAFGSPGVVNPFDRFGDHMRLALKAPAAYQLMTWLESGPGAVLPPRSRPPRQGRWVVCGYGRLGRELTADLRSEGIEVTVVEPHPSGEPDDGLVVGDGVEPEVLARTRLADAVGFVAGTDNDTTNLSLVAAARKVNGSLFVAARQNRPASAPLFAAMQIDSLLVPTEVIAHEVYAQLATPLLWRFLRELPTAGDEWAAGIVERLLALCGTRLQALWKVRLTPQEAPALVGWLATGEARLGNLLRDPETREDPLHAVPLLVLRDDEAVLGPADDFVLAEGDEILLAGRPSARRALSTLLFVDAALEYVVSGRQVPSSWIWRKLSRSTKREPEPAAGVGSGSGP